MVYSVKYSFYVWYEHYFINTYILKVANFANTKVCKQSRKVTEILAYGYSSERTHRELSNEYQHDRVEMVFKNLCISVLWTKVALAFEGIPNRYQYSQGKIGLLKFRISFIITFSVIFRLNCYYAVVTG